MNKNLYALLLCFLFWGCEKTEEVRPGQQSSELTVNWQHPYYGNSVWNDNARIYLYESEEEYKSLLGKAVVSKSLADIYPPNGGTITEVNSVSFDNLKPIKYWIKIFNTYNIEGMVEYNTESASTLQFPLIENTHTEVTIPIKRVYINSFTIQKIEIYDIPDRIHSKVGEKVELRLFEAFPFGYAADDVTRDTQTVTVNDSIISYQPANAKIKSFNSWWCDPTYFVLLSNAGSTDWVRYEIKIFDLLKSNAHFGNEYIQLNDQNKIKYKLYVTWDIK